MPKFRPATTSASRSARQNDFLWAAEVGLFKTVEADSRRGRIADRVRMPQTEWGIVSRASVLVRAEVTSLRVQRSNQERLFRYELPLPAGAGHFFAGAKK
jgi:hypothetical protein